MGRKSTEIGIWDWDPDPTGSPSSNKGFPGPSGPKTAKKAKTKKTVKKYSCQVRFYYPATVFNKGESWYPEARSVLAG